jgi:hypothetical protein
VTRTYDLIYGVNSIVNTLAVKELLVLDVILKVNISPVFKLNEGFNEPVTTVPEDRVIFCNPVLEFTYNCTTAETELRFD